MPNWNDVLDEIQAAADPLDSVRRRYLKELHEKTGRNIICYYSAWLQRPGIRGTEITDADKNGFMNAVHGLKRKKGLDLFLHTPGGEVAAAESIVHYLREMFGTDIRAIVPQISMSAGTMIACSCKSIIMGKHSNLGPVDPQFGGLPAQGVIEEFNKAIEEVKKDPGSLPIWQTILAKYHPTFIGNCERAVQWSQEVVSEWLKTGMFDGDKNGTETAEKIAQNLTNHSDYKSHDRHIHMQDCMDLDLKIDVLEDLDDNLQDNVLSIHHAFMHTLSNSETLKVIESHEGKALFHRIRA